MAEGKGFEPSIQFPVYWFSKPAPSATRPPLRTGPGAARISRGRPGKTAGMYGLGPPSSTALKPPESDKNHPTAALPHPFATDIIGEVIFSRRRTRLPKPPPPPAAAAPAPDSATEAPLRGLPVILLMALGTLGQLALNIVLPSLPAIGADLHVPHGGERLVLSVFLIGFAGGQLLVGPLSDRFGRAAHPYPRLAVIHPPRCRRRAHGIDRVAAGSATAAGAGVPPPGLWLPAPLRATHFKARHWCGFSAC